MPGLRFECQRGCVACCDQKGYVYVTDDDVARAARYLGLTESQFRGKYIYQTKLRQRLRTPRDQRQCHFLVHGGCSIHPAKPLQCRAFPFWPELVENRDQWNQTATWCPGIGTGQLVQIGTALERADELRRAFPVLYGP